MTIRKGEEWGVTVACPHDLRLVSDDATLASLVARGGAPPLGVDGGDLFCAVGEPTPRAWMQRVPVDLLRVRVDDRHAVAVAHVVVRRSWWGGQIVAVMNVDHLGRWNVAPRAHPNDGRFDVVEVAASMGLRQRWLARGRLPLGTHVPHPSIRLSTAAHSSWTFDRPMRVWIDGVAAGRCRRLEVDLEPDAFELHV